jgi:predicted negative regulator of RcsB-dependent stress response
MTTPFIATQTAVERLSNPLAKSLILAELAGVQAENGLIDDAFTSIAQIPNRSEKRNVLSRLAFQSVGQNKTELLIRLVQTMFEVDTGSSATVGRLAQSLLEAGNEKGKIYVTTALELVRAVEHPFDSERLRYDFVAKLIEIDVNEQSSNIRQFIETFTDTDYRDWALLAFAKRFAVQNQWADAEKIAGDFLLPRRQSWAFFELSRLATGEKKQKLLERAGEILETIFIEPDSAEALSVQLRILGKTAFEAENEEVGIRLLERSEAAAACVPTPMQRFRTQYFLAKVLRELRQIDSVRNYLNIRELAESKLSGIERSRVWVWLAEAEPSDDNWTTAIQSASEPDNQSADIPCAERVAEILKRFSHRNRQNAPTGEPDIDAVRLDAENFEEYYFSAFTITDCGC